MLIIALCFTSLQNFLDPQLTKEGNPYGPERYKEIVKERYYISKNINTSYNEVGKMTPTERYYIIEFINQELKKQEEFIRESKNKSKK